MPITRFEIRNEYSLADSELYRAADKDDPEALLEGVAMAGLVGVLRQLGDLAEFAAEIFHNLHEEVMVTAARGHSLMIRVQQLETEVLPIERAFLSQTDHSSFFYHTGVDWHPNLHMDMNLITQGDLPRFIMDSYEECRPPPRLFLLDKFDIAGAGACLKRYTDPSFFKVETEDMTSADVQREKKILKLKKKGARGRNGETTEVVPTSHTKLHQLFLEERTENGVNHHSRRVKLKRRLNGFPFDSNTGRSYMEEILKSPSPDHKVLHEVDVNSLSCPMAGRSDENEFGLETIEVGPVIPDSGCVGRERSLHLSPDRKEILHCPKYEPAEVTTDDQLGMIPITCHSFATGGTSSTLDRETAEKVIAVDAENNSEVYLTGFESNVIASEVENYVDATSTLETEVDTEAGFTLNKNDFSAPHIKSQSLVSNANEEHHPTWTSDCQSSGHSMISDEGNNSSIKEMSGCSLSDSASSSAENPQSEKSANRISSPDTPEIGIIATSSYQNNADEGFTVDQHSQTGVCDDTCISTTAINHHPSHFGQGTTLCSNESIPTSMHSESEVTLAKIKSKQSEYYGVASNLNVNENEENVIADQPCYPIVSDFELHSGENSARLPGGQHLVSEPRDKTVSCTSNVRDINCHITDSSSASLDLLHEGETDQDDQNASNMFNVLSLSTNDVPEMIPTTNPISGESDDVPKYLENMSSHIPDIIHSEDAIKSMISQEQNLLSELDNEDSNASTDAQYCSSDTMEASFGQKLNETLLGDAQTVDVGPNCSNSSTENLISSDTLIASLLANSSALPEKDLVADEEDVIPEQETIRNGTSALQSPASCEVVGLQATGMTDIIFPSDSEALGSSFHTIENLEEPVGTSDTVEMDGITLCTGSTAQEVTKMSGSTNLKSPDEADVLLDEPDSEAKKSNVDMVPTVCVVSHNLVVDNAHSNVDFNKVVEEHVHCPGDSSPDEAENDKNCPSGSHEESFVEVIGQTEAAASDSEAVMCNNIIHDHLRLEVSDTVPNSQLDLEVDDNWEFVGTTTIQSLLEQSGSGTEHVFFHQSGLGNDVPDAKAFPIDHGPEESKAQEKASLPPNEFDQELSHSGEISSVLSFLLPIGHQQMLDDDDHRGENDSAPTLSLADCPKPPSVSELQRQSNYDEDASGYLKEPLGSIFPPSNPLTVTNQINLADLPPLPPLPPVQWRMGKFQQDSAASTEGGVTKHIELFPQSIPPLNPSTHDTSSSLVNSFADDFRTFPLTSSTGSVSTFPQTTSSIDVVSSSPSRTSTDYVSLSLEEMAQSSLIEATHCPVQTSPKVESKEEKAENSCLTLEIKDMRETIDVVPDMEEKQQSIVPTRKTEFTSPEEMTQSSLEEATHYPVQTTPKPESKEEEATNSCSILEIKDMCDNIDVVPDMEEKQQSILSTPKTKFTSPEEMTRSSLEEATHSPVQTTSKPESKEEAKKSCSVLETKDMHETIDVVLDMEDKQQQPVMPTPKREFMSSEEDGLLHGSHMLKLPRPRNPLIEDVAVLDKSKLRKVTERDRPQIQKGEERDAFLEQIRNKSFNLKPAMASRPSIQHPKTNLRVAAILEKANAIRQALADSDEDDDDSWSDS